MTHQGAIVTQVAAGFDALQTARKGVVLLMGDQTIAMQLCR